MGAAAAAGAPLPVLIVVGPLVGLACGLLNGWLVTRFSVPAIIVTIGTMSLYRGISFIALGDQAYRGRAVHCWTPPAQIRTCPIRASGSYLGCLTAKRSLGQG
jgi:ribose/xylose/arabinose/galactoside ABC-type transport system permease subunit